VSAAKVLLVEDEAPLRDLLARRLGRLGYDVEAVGSAEEALAGPLDCDVAVCDLALPGLSGLELIGRLRAARPDAQAIVLTGQGSVATAIEAMKLGAYHYFEKPVKFDELALYVGGAVEKRRLAAENRDLKDGLARQARAERLVGSSAPVAELRSLIERVAQAPTPVLIEGETGTGKDLVARAIHQASPRRDRPYVALNCGALAESLLENELFGHVAGAFTGATKEQRGVFEVASGGTLFIDEVAEMSLEIQKKFLRVLENGEFRRLGESRTRVAEVRVIAATNRVLADLVAAGAFREDLYYRLNVVSIRTPPLREHPEDLTELVEELLGRVRASHGRDVSVEPDVLDAFATYAWPGNVRELRNVIERAVVLSPGPKIRLADCPGVIAEARAARPAPQEPAAPAAADAPSDKLEDVERVHIQRVLESTGGNKTQAAKRLGVSLRTLYRRIEKLDIDA